VSDARLRQLQRDAATGDLAARARLLTERVRIGDLAPDRLQLAAYLGDEAAEEALGQRPHVPPTITVGRWVRGLARPTVGEGWPEWAAQAYALAAAAAARSVLPCFAGRDPVAATRAVEALDAWIACPCDEHGRASAAAASHVPQPPPGPAGLFASRGVRFAGLAVLRAAAIPLGRAGLPRGATPPETIAADTAADAARATSPEAVRVAIREALVPWALGT
jgi:hypothetical protein